MVCHPHPHSKSSTPFISLQIFMSSKSSSRSSTSQNKMQISSSTNERIPLWGIIVSLVFINNVLVLRDFYSSFRFIVSIFKSFLGIISYIRVSSYATEEICRNDQKDLNAAHEDETETDDIDHRNLWISELKMVMEKTDKISGLFEEEEPSLMEVKEAFDVFDENKDGFIDAKELRNGLFWLGFMEELASEDECQRMIKGFDHNFDGRIDFNEFVKLLQRSFCSSDN